MILDIRNARHGDMETLVELLGELFSLEADFSPDEGKQRRGLKMLLDGCGKHRCVKVADIDGAVIGMCTAQLMISTAEGAFSALVEDLVVHPAYRRQGAGRALLDAVELWARDHGASRLQLLADRDNDPGLAFYKTRSWKHTRLICLKKKHIIDMGRDHAG